MLRHVSSSMVQTGTPPLHSSHSPRSVVAHPLALSLRFRRAEVPRLRVPPAPVTGPQCSPLIRRTHLEATGRTGLRSTLAIRHRETGAAWPPLRSTALRERSRSTRSRSSDLEPPEEWFAASQSSVCRMTEPFLGLRNGKNKGNSTTGKCGEPWFVTSNHPAQVTRVLWKPSETSTSKA